MLGEKKSSSKCEGCGINPGTREAVNSMSSKPAWFTQGVPGQSGRGT